MQRVTKRLSLGDRALGALLAALAVIAVTIGYTGFDPFDDSTTVQAEFSDASGIGVVGQDVRIAGVPVGEITDIERSGDDAVVTMKLEADAGTIRDDATAELRPNLPFEGTAHVDLSPGSPNANELDEDKRIDVAATTTYVPLDRAMRVFAPDVRAAVQTTAAELAGGLESPGADGLRQAIEGSPDLLADLAPAATAAGGSTGKELAGAVKGLGAVSDELAERTDRFAPLLQDANRTLAAIDRDGGASLDSVLAKLPTTLVELDRGGRALEAIVARLDPLAVDLRPGLDRLAPTLAEATPLLERAGPVFKQVTPLIATAREALRAGADGARPATNVLAELNPTLEVLDDSLLPALAKPTEELEIPAYRAFLNLFGGGGGASRPFQTEEQTTPMTPETGHFMRFGLRFLTGAGAPLPPCALLEQANPALAAALATAGGCTP
jgi:phospholipid/cholesterol/gamma-HCH transport system substrate-binding protein